MTRLLTILLFAFTSSIFAQPSQPVQQKIFVYGGQVNKRFVAYVRTLTGKENPRICFLPTATGDSERYINYWYDLCSDLQMIPSVMRVWINSPDQDKSWEEILTNVDAIIVGGGNTLNMIAIWKAQGIDAALKKALEKGVVLAGGSAGSLCWFTGGTTDSRPKELSIVECLGFLNYSHCPHYNSEKSRRPLYHDNIMKGVLKEGYACDDKAGLLFINGKLSKGVALDDKSNSYFVTIKDGKIAEEKIESEVLK